MTLAAVVLGLIVAGVVGAATTLRLWLTRGGDWNGNAGNYELGDVDMDRLRDRLLQAEKEQW